jgi:transglycosylase-like protein with SLT domain
MSTKQELEQEAAKDAHNYGIDPVIFVAQINQESGFNPHARNAVSGAAGIAQFMPATAAGYGIDPYDPIAALDAAAKYDRSSLTQFSLKTTSGGYSQEDYSKMLAAYNWGGGNLQDDISAHGPNWLQYAPLETQNYIKNILGNQSLPQGVVAIGGPSGPVSGAVAGAVSAAQGAAKEVAASDPLGTFTASLAWIQQNTVRVGLFVLALMLIAAGLFAIGSAVE